MPGRNSRPGGWVTNKYFLERGFRHFAYLSLLGLECVTRQHRAFADAVRAAGCTCAELGIAVDVYTQNPAPALPIRKPTAWLKALPKPVAILTWTGCQEVIDCCHDAGLLVPEEVALFSGSNDELLCEVCDIPISAIQQPVEQIGTEAATLLDQMMRKEALSGEPFNVAASAFPPEWFRYE